MDVGFTILAIVLVIFLAFRFWLQYQKRILIHRERLVALEKGIDLPPMQEEIRLRRFTFERFLLLSGSVWLAAGLSGTAVSMIILNAVHSHSEAPHFLDVGPPLEMGLMGLVPAAIGLAQLVVYFIERRQQRG
jgi:hypothetical protein